MSEQDQQQVTIKQPSTQQAGQPMTLQGTAPAGDQVHVQGVSDPMGRPVKADVAPDGSWGAHAMAPVDPGDYTVTVSTESTGQTTATTFAVKPKP